MSAQNTAGDPAPWRTGTAGAVNGTVPAETVGFIQVGPIQPEEPGELTTNTTKTIDVPWEIASLSAQVKAAEERADAYRRGRDRLQAQVNELTDTRKDADEYRTLYLRERAARKLERARRKRAEYKLAETEAVIAMRERDEAEGGESE